MVRSGMKTMVTNGSRRESLPRDVPRCSAQSIRRPVCDAVCAFHVPAQRAQVVEALAVSTLRRVAAKEEVPAEIRRRAGCSPGCGRRPRGWSAQRPCVLEQPSTPWRPRGCRTPGARTRWCDSIATSVTRCTDNQSRNASRSAVVVPNVRVPLLREPSGPGRRTDATTASLCTSRPAQRSATTSTGHSFRSSAQLNRPEVPVVKKSGVRAQGNSSRCSRLLRHASRRAHGTRNARRRRTAAPKFSHDHNRARDRPPL